MSQINLPAGKEFTFTSHSDGSATIDGLSVDDLPKPEPELVNTVARFQVAGPFGGEPVEVCGFKVNNDPGRNWRITGKEGQLSDLVDIGSLKSRGSATWDEIKSAAVKGSLRTFSPARPPQPSQPVGITVTNTTSTPLQPA